MKKYKILILNGPNLGALGKREPEIYGTQNMDDVVLLGKTLLKDIWDSIELFFYQNNSEGKLIDRLEKAKEENIDGIVINAGAYTHTSLALADCLSWIKIPTVEVHLTNIMAREESIRHKSLIAPHCIGVVAGFGVMSYVLGILALYQYLSRM